MASHLPVPFADRSVSRAERANLVEQYRAAAQGQIARINEHFERGDTVRRVDNGFSMYDDIVERTGELHGRIQSTRDEDLRELLTAGLASVFGAAVFRTTAYIRGS